MEKIDNDVKTSWLQKFGMDKVTMDEMLEHFRFYYKFEGTFEELIGILMKDE